MSHPDRPIHMSALLDRSGSMQRIADDVIGGFNAFIDGQRSEPGEVSVTLVTFDSREPHDVIYDHRPIGEVGELTSTDYRPRGGTPLFDAIALLIARLDVTDSPDVDQVVVIITDGLENASRFYPRVDVARMIEEHTEAGWTFVFLAADPDSFAEGRLLRVDSVGQWKADAKGVKEMWSDVGGNLISYRKKTEIAKAYARKQFLDQVNEDEK